MTRFNALFFTAAALVTSAFADPIRVLYYNAYDVAIGQSALTAMIGADPRFNLAGSRVTATNEVVSLASLLSYDVVLANADADPAFSGNDLADYVDGGGRLVTSTFLGYVQAGGWNPGRFATAGYNPLGGASADAFTSSSFDLATASPGHPILAGVTSLSSSFYNGDYMTLSPGATLVASWTNGRPLVATNAAGTVTAVTVYSNSLFLTAGPAASGDFNRLFANALAVTAVPEPASMAILATGLVALRRRRRK